MARFKIERVLELPSDPSPSTMYIVKGSDAGLAEVYFSSDDGLTVRNVISKTQISGLISTAIAGFSAIKDVQNIAERNAIAIEQNCLVLVTDATGDLTVKSGGAMYLGIASTNSWVKLSEFESMDIIPEWNNIVGKPNSSVEDIDGAVTLRHSHLNKDILNALGENSNGDLTYKGINIIPSIAESQW